MTVRSADMPEVGPPDPVRFPPVSRHVLDNGLAVWAIDEPARDVAIVSLVLPAGAADDPPDRPGLMSLTADLVDEGAGGRDAIALADALARLGSRLTIDVSADATVLSAAALSRTLNETLRLLSDVVLRPHLATADFERVRDLRRSRLRQLTRGAGTVADRAFASAVFGDHPYAHGTLGTTKAIEAVTLDEVRAAWERSYRPAGATLVIAGSVAERGSYLDQWTPGNDVGRRFPDSGKTTPDVVSSTDRGTTPSRVVRLVDRPGAPQSELRVGHLGLRRSVPEYHTLVTLNAVLGGQFTSRLNRNLRETRGITYGARSAFGMYRRGGMFSCDTSVQADQTAVGVSEILAELRAVREPHAVGAEELALAQASLARGYVRHFETASQLVRGLVELAAYDLPADTFDQFVPAVSAVTSANLSRAANESLRPDDCAVVVVGDATVCRGPLEANGWTVLACEPEF